MLTIIPCFGKAQITVAVKEAGSAVPVPYAHIEYATLSDGVHKLAVSGPDGLCILPLTAEQMAGRVALHVSFMGYAPWTDTVSNPLGVLTCALYRDPTHLQEMVVTGQYTAGSPDRSVHKVRVVNATQIQRMAANNLGDALRNELNIRLAQDNVLGSSMSMQGLGGENVKILIDGVPVVGRQNGNVDLSQIDLAGIERIELIEGPLSVNYGTNALAGTINLITRKSGGSPAAIKATGYAEHIGRLNTTVTASRRWGRNEVVLSGGRNFFAGWDPRERGIPSLSDHIADSTRFQQWKPREQFFGRINYRWNGDRWSFGYKGEALHDVILNRGKPRAPYFETAFDERYTTVRLDNALFAERTFTNGARLNVLAAHNRYERGRNTWYRDLTTLGEQLAAGGGMQDTTRFTLTNARATYARPRKEKRPGYEIGTDHNIETGSGERIPGGQRLGDHAVFASMEFGPGPRLTLRPGVRLAYNTRYDAPVVPSMNVRWQFADRFTWRASYAQGFRAPSLKELYFQFVDINHDIVGNPDLHAERSHAASTGVGYRHAKDKVVYTSEANLFYNDVHELIGLVQIAGASYTYENIGRLRTAGGSIGAGWDNGHWVASTGLSLLGRYDSFATELNEPWLFTQEVRASLTRQWQRQGWSASVFWKYQGHQTSYVRDETNGIIRGSIAAFQFADVSVSKSLMKRSLGVTVGCKNLLDVTDLNSTMAGGIHNTGSASVPMATGRTFFVRLELDLKRKGA